MLNNQAPEPRIHNKNVLQVHSIFYTIQGEGPFCGKPALFIRLAGCVIQCPGCDTDYTSRRKHYHVQDLIAHCQRTMYKGGLIVITGGEPFRQDLSLFIPELTKRGFIVQVETNGMVPPSQGVHFSTDLHQPQGKAYIVCSPKDKVINEQILRACCCLKYVMGAEDVGEDGLPNTVLGRRLKGIIARPPSWFQRPIYLQPMDEKDEEKNARNIHTCIQSCMEKGYTLQLQIHKYLNLE